MPSPTPIHFAVNQHLDEQFTRLDHEKITHWLMRFSARSPVDIDNCRGSRITLGGDMEFDGSARHVFWTFIRPCLQDIIGATLTMADDLGRKYPPKVARQGISESASLLKTFVTKTYTRMVEIDRRLRGKGNPRSAEPYDPSDLIAFLHAEIDERSNALIEHRPVGFQRLKIYIADNPISALGLAVTALGSVAVGYLFTEIKKLLLF